MLTSTKLLVLAGFLLLGFTVGTGSWGHFSQPAVRTSTVGLPAQFFVSLLWVMVGYSGWNAATYVAEEVRRPERTLPLALARGHRGGGGAVPGPERDLHLRHAARTMKGKTAVGAISAANLFGPGVAGAFAR